MEEKREAELQELIKKLQETEEEKNSYIRRQFYMSAVTAACSAMILVIFLAAFGAVVPSLQASLGDIRTAAANMKKISTELSDADLNGMLKNIDKMTVASERGIEEALGKIEAIDIETLNKAIRDLSDAVGPFAKLTNLFGG